MILHPKLHRECTLDAVLYDIFTRTSEFKQKKNEIHKYFLKIQMLMRTSCTNCIGSNTSSIA